MQIFSLFRASEYTSRCFNHPWESIKFDSFFARTSSQTEIIEWNFSVHGDLCWVNILSQPCQLRVVLILANTHTQKYAMSWNWSWLLNGWALSVFLRFQETAWGMEDVQPEFWEMYWSDYFTSKRFKKQFISFSIFEVGGNVSRFDCFIPSFCSFFSHLFSVAGTTATEAGHCARVSISWRTRAADNYV